MRQGQQMHDQQESQIRIILRSPDDMQRLSQVSSLKGLNLQGKGYKQYALQFKTFEETWRRFMDIKRDIGEFARVWIATEPEQRLKQNVQKFCEKASHKDLQKLRERIAAMSAEEKADAFNSTEACRLFDETLTNKLQ